MVLEKGIPGEKYHIGDNCEKENKAVVHLICDLLDERRKLENGHPRPQLIRFIPERPGHDRRYAIDSTKISKEAKWKPEVSFENGIRMTIDWYVRNSKRIKGVLDGSYRDYYRKQYKGHLNGHQ
jgi:dTDP-glucose 4,6-dehydratase